MNTALNIKEIDELLQRINLQHVKLNQLSGNIPIIELDLEMKLVLDLYELLDKLKSMSRQDNVIDKSQVNDQQTIAESATDFESINLIEKEQGGLSEQIDLMAAMEKEETEPYKATLENKRSEIFKEYAASPVEEIAPEAPEIKMKPVQHVTQSRKTTAELFDEPATVARSFTGKTTLHDKMSSGKTERSVASHLQSKPLTDLKKSIGINERFVFVKELFNGDQKLYNQHIELLNNFSAYEEARLHLFENLALQMEWNMEGKLFMELSELIRRRFNG